MYLDKTIALLLPARNEAAALPGVLKMVPQQVDRVLVLDNASTDSTAQVAKEHGAEVVIENKPGYGRACLRGLKFLETNPPDVVAFADADGSDDLSFLPEMLKPLVRGDSDLALACRIPDSHDAMSAQQRLGNWLATQLIRLFWRHVYNDLGPMRAIAWKALSDLHMKDPNYGWTVEMQIRALKKRLRVREYPVLYYKRAAGRSKVSGSLVGSLRAGIKILWIIGREAVLRKSSWQQCDVS